MKKTIAWLAFALAVAAIARFWIFRLQDKEISPDFYERKAKLEDFWIPEKSAPQGFRLTPTLPGGRENPSVLDTAAMPTLPKGRVQFPATEKIVETHAACYANALGDQVLLLASQYGPGGAPEPPTGFFREGVFLVTAAAPSPVLRETFLNALSERLGTLKKDGVKLNKLKTIGNVLLKLFMNILVGAFAFILALFLAKYFLITKAVEE